MLEPVRIALLAVGAAALAASLASAQAPEPPAYGAGAAPQLFDGMGPHRRAVTTDSPAAQAFFDQGLAWLHSFNHDEAVRSFTRATEIDPECAMAWWGISYAQGPNYNDPGMPEARSVAAWDALQKALEHAPQATAVEQALIDALAHRYARPEPEDRSELDAAFADAMADAWESHSSDPDVGAIYAEAMMTKHPWDLYTNDREPARDETLTIVNVLERVLMVDPDNPGANHLYIHAVEPSARKDRGVIAADRLSDLVPGSGHLQHMPSHIYVQVGMWERSIEQNAKAMEADAAYRALSPDQGIQHMYMVHNAHMLAFSAMMIGREAEAMAAAQSMLRNVPAEVLPGVAPFLDAWACSVYDVQKRFGRWDAILAEPAPPTFLPVTTAVWRAHRAIAYAAKKDFEAAEREHQNFRAAMVAVPPGPVPDIYETAMSFLGVSDLFIAAEIELQKGDYDESARLLEEAAVLEDDLGYGEPPMWLQPVRHTLGAVRMKQGRYADAERVYRDDLAKWEGNGWSLYGLSRALEEQGKHAEAKKVRAEYERVWAQADEPTETSCKCIPVT